MLRSITKIIAVLLVFSIIGCSTVSDVSSVNFMQQMDESTCVAMITGTPYDSESRLKELCLFKLASEADKRGVTKFYVYDYNLSEIVESKTEINKKGEDQYYIEKRLVVKMYASFNPAENLNPEQYYIVKDLVAKIPDRQKVGGTEVFCGLVSVIGLCIYYFAILPKQNNS